MHTNIHLFTLALEWFCLVSKKDKRIKNWLWCFVVSENISLCLPLSTSQFKLLHKCCRHVKFWHERGAFNSGVGWLCPATVRVSQKTLLFTATATLKLSATGRRAAPLDSLDVYNPKISLQCHFEEVWVSHSPLSHKLMPCVTSILIPDLSFSDVKAFWQPRGSSSHQLSRHLRNDAAEGCGLSRSSFTNTPLSDLSVSPASPFQTEGHLLPR